MILFILMLILNIYLILIFKNKKKKIFNSFFILDEKSLIIKILFYFIFFYFVLKFLNFFFIFFSYSSIDFLGFLIRCLIIKIYYRFFNKINYSNIEFFIYSYAISLNKNNKIYLCIYSCYQYYYSSMIIFIIYLCYYSISNTIYNFDQSFDEAFFGFNSGYKIYLFHSGKEKLNKYHRYIINLEERDNIDCYLIFNKDFKFKSRCINNMYKRGYL